MKIGIYARVSSDDGSQDPRNQLVPLREFAKALKGKVVQEYVDCGSGAGTADRESFLRMLADADRHRFDLLLIWALDRLSREGVPNTLAYLQRLKKNGIGVRSLQESWLNTDDEGLGELLLSIFAWVAAQERQRLIVRVRAGMRKAKESGKALGRPKGSRDTVKRKRSGYFQRYERLRKKNDGILSK